MKVNIIGTFHVTNSQTGEGIDLDEELLGDLTAEVEELINSREFYKGSMRCSLAGCEVEITRKDENGLQ